jgi:hypothetical protein
MAGSLVNVAGFCRLRSRLTLRRFGDRRLLQRAVRRARCSVPAIDSTCSAALSPAVVECRQGGRIHFRYRIIHGTRVTPLIRGVRGQVAYVGLVANDPSCLLYTQV